MTPLSRLLPSVMFMAAATIALPAWGQQYFLYAPQPVAAEQKNTPPQQGSVLVQEIEIQKGDTLFGISRKFSGHGTYFPQILLFNSIKNPNLIYPGKTLKIPVSPNDATSSEHSDASKQIELHGKSRTAETKKSLSAAEPKAAPAKNRDTAAMPSASTELSLSDLKTVAAGKSRTNKSSKKMALRTKKSQQPTASPTAPAAGGALLDSHGKNPASGDSTTGQTLFEAGVKAYRQDNCRTALELFDRYLTENSGSPLAADANLYKAECYLKLSSQ